MHFSGELEVLYEEYKRANEALDAVTSKISHDYGLGVAFEITNTFIDRYYDEKNEKSKAI